MKRCPFCAEEILDAAIVCKHCGPDLHAKPSKTGLILGILAAVLVIGFLVLGAVNSEHGPRGDFIAFDKQRADWHRRCDAYVGQPFGPGPERTAAEDCKRELAALTEYAKNEGW